MFKKIYSAKRGPMMKLSLEALEDIHTLSLEDEVPHFERKKRKATCSCDTARNFCAKKKRPAFFETNAKDDKCLYCNHYVVWA